MRGLQSLTLWHPLSTHMTGNVPSVSSFQNDQRWGVRAVMTKYSSWGSLPTKGKSWGRGMSLNLESEKRLNLFIWSPPDKVDRISSLIETKLASVKGSGMWTWDYGTQYSKGGVRNKGEQHQRRYTPVLEKVHNVAGAGDSGRASWREPWAKGLWAIPPSCDFFWGEAVRFAE